MIKPPFEKVTGQRLDEALRHFFLEGLGYERIDNDPDEKPGAPRYWRMVVPVGNSQPYAVAFQADLATMERRRVSRLYIEKVVPHRDGSPSIIPSLYCFTDGSRYVFFSADPARNRDDRFDLSEGTMNYTGVRDKLERLHISRLQFQVRLGRKRPLVDFLFETTPLSADERFKRYVHDARKELMQVVVKDAAALGSVVFHLIEDPEGRDSDELKFTTKAQKLKQPLEELYLQLGLRLGDAVAAAVDTLLLRYVMIRFLEAYHPDAMDGLKTTDELLKDGKVAQKVATGKGKKVQGVLYGSSAGLTGHFTETELEIAEMFSASLGIDASRAKKKSKGGDQLKLDLFSFDDEKAGTAAVLEEEGKREARLGGDFYLADLGRAARDVEKALLGNPKSKGSKLLQDFLGRTSDTQGQWDFRYEDLRPQTLQDYYESALGTAIQLNYNKQSKALEISVERNQRQRKELGAYYTDPRLCRFMVERTVKPLFAERLERLRKAILAKDVSAARQAFTSVVTMSLCDPTMGSAPFLRSAFDYLSQQYLSLWRVIAEGKTHLPEFIEEISKDYPFLTSKGGRMDEDGVGRWEWHILKRMLYGIDIDLKAVCIACQTFALSALKYLKQGERFPSFFNINLKLGNALISPVRPADRPRLADRYGAELGKLVRLRVKAMMLRSTASSYEELKGLLQQIDEIKKPIVQELVEDKVYPILEDYTDDLRPFCCELEFPELFFDEDGRLRKDAGIDVIIGNPPWEEAYIKDAEFLSSHGFDPKEKVDKMTKKYPELGPIYDRYLGAIDKWQEWAGSSAYERQQGGRHRNYWRMATETSWNLLHSDSRISLVVPSGIISDEGPAVLRQWLFSEGEADRFITFEKQNEVFSGSQAFTVFAFKRGQPTKRVAHVDGLVNPDELETLPEPVWIDLDLVRHMSPGYLTIPAVWDTLDAQILNKLYAHPLITDPSARFHAIPWSGDYNITLDRDKFVGGSVAVLEGKHVEQYATVDPSNVRYKVKKPRLRGGADLRDYRITWRDISGTQDARRVIATMLPKQCVTSDLLNTLVIEGDDADRLLLLGVVNSLTFEWRVRQVARSNHVKPMVMRQMPCPRPEPGDPDFALVVNRAARLLVADSRLADLAPFAPEGAITGSMERHEALCEIDAAVARMFNLTGAELDRVLSLYDKIAEGTRSRVRQLFGGADESEEAVLIAEARRLFAAHQEEYLRERSAEKLKRDYANAQGERLIAAALLASPEEGSGELALLEVVRDYNLSPTQASPPSANWNSTLESPLMSHLSHLTLGLAELTNKSGVLERLRGELKGWKVVASQEWREHPDDSPVLPMIFGE